MTNGHRARAAKVLRTIDGLDHMGDVIVPDNCFADSGAQDRFAQQVVNAAPATAQEYEEDVCDSSCCQGEEASVPCESVCHVWDDKALKLSAEEVLGRGYEVTEARLDELQSESAGKWVTLSEVLPGNGEIPLARRPAVFVSFRKDDPAPNPVPEPGLVRDALLEGDSPLPGGPAERICHHLALCRPEQRLQRVLALCYTDDSVSAHYVPVAPDGGKHPAFRPEPPGSPYGKSHPEIDDPNCRKCPECSELELVHENKKIAVASIWLCLLPGEGAP